VITTSIERKPRVLQRIGLSASTLDRLIKAGRFPAPVRLSPNTVGWQSSAIDIWIDERMRADERSGVQQ